MHFSALLASLALAPLASAHFQLLYPAARGYDEDTLATYAFPALYMPPSPSN